MSPVRQHLAHVAALAALAASSGGTVVPAHLSADAGGPVPLPPVDGTEAQLALARLTADRRALKDTQSLERKIEAKRGMIPAYADWIDGLLSAGTEAGQGVQDEVLPTIMVWKIDTGDIEGALPLAAYVLRYGVALPAQFERQAACLIAEEVADGCVDRGLTPPVALLEEYEELLSGEDMPDEVRAKFTRAIGEAYDRMAEADDSESGAAGAKRAAQAAAVERYTRALQLDARVGVKKKRDQLERLLAAPPTDTTNSGQAG